MGRDRLEAPELGRAAGPRGVTYFCESICFSELFGRFSVSKGMLNAASHLPQDPVLLQAMIAELQAQNAKLTTTLRAHDLVVQALHLQIAKLKKQAFDKSSEKIER
ncbi:MAG: hypothetical protein H5U12_25890, partial [Hoeflea sp.]|nr:hypothetical protein [Hoeflea sp.]